MQFNEQQLIRIKFAGERRETTIENQKKILKVSALTGIIMGILSNWIENWVVLIAIAVVVGIVIGAAYSKVFPLTGENKEK